MTSFRTDTLIGEWRRALDGPLDPVQWAEIKLRYDESLELDREYSTLYDEQRKIFLAELEEAKDKLGAELQLSSKSELATRCGFANGAPSGWTKNRMIEMLLHNTGVENEHSRVQRIWNERHPKQVTP